MKKYCECFQAGIKCSDLCKCDGCKNCDFVPGSKDNGNRSNRVSSNEKKGFEKENKDDFLLVRGEFLGSGIKKHLDSFNSFNKNILEEIEFSHYNVRDNSKFHNLRTRPMKKFSGKKEKLFLKPNCKENVIIRTAGKDLKIEIEN